MAGAKTAALPQTDAEFIAMSALQLRPPDTTENA